MSTKLWGVALVAALLTGSLAGQVGPFPLFRQREDTITYRVPLENAAGLEEKAPVLLSGVRVGSVREIALIAEGALVTIDVRKDVVIRRGAQARVTSVGLIGERQLEIQQGPRGAPRLPEGGVIPAVPAEMTIGEVMDLAASIGRDVQELSRELRRVAPKGDALLEDLAQLTRELRLLVAENRHAVAEGVENLRALSERLDRMAARSAPQVSETVEDVGALVESLQRTARNLERISDRLERGEGTLGRLLRGPGPDEELSDALTAITDAVETYGEAAKTLSQTEVRLMLRAEYLAAHETGKGYFFADVQPTKGRFYRLGASSQPFGLRSFTRTVTTTTGPTGEVSTVEVEEEKFRDLFAFSAMAGFVREPFVFRAGLFESTGGVGGDLFLLENRLRLTAEAWDFTRGGLNPHAKVFASYSPLRWLELFGGWDDFLNQERDSVFLGAGLRWEADELKYIVPGLPLP